MLFRQNFTEFFLFHKLIMDPDITLMFTPSSGQPITREKLRVSLSKDYNRKTLPAPHENHVSQIWDLRVKMNPKLYNGTKFRIDSVTNGNDDDGCVTFNLGITDYKDFIGTNWSPDAKKYRGYGERDHGNTQAYLSDALGVGSLVCTADDQIILLRRSEQCGEAVGLLDIPGGHPEPKEILGKMETADINLDDIKPEDVVNEIFDSTLREICDEVNIPKETLTDPELLGIARNVTSSGRPSSEYLVKCSLSSQEVGKLYHKGSHADAYESTALVFIPMKEVITLQEKKEVWNDLAPSAKGCILLYQAMMKGSKNDK